MDGLPAAAFPPLTVIVAAPRCFERIENQRSGNLPPSIAPRVGDNGLLG